MSDVPPGILEAYLQYVADQQADVEAMAAEQGVTPEDLMAMPMPTGEQQNFYGMMPSYNLEGDPYTLSNMLNQMQDVNQLIADPVFQGLGGVGGFSPQAFQPTVTWEQVESPEYRRWQNYLNTPDSFEGMIAAELREGGTPYSAIRKIQARVAEDPEGPLAQSILAIFEDRDDAGPTGQINWGLASQAATDIDEMRANIPALGAQGQTVAPDGSIVGGGEIVESQGPNGEPILLRRMEEPSPLQEKYNELGIPNPFEQYTAESFMGPEWAQQAGQFQELQPQYQAQIASLDEAMHEAYQNMLQYQNWTPEDIAPPAPEPEGEEEEVRPRPVPGPGMPTTPQGGDTSYWMPQGSQQARFQAGYAIQDPNEWLDWYNEHLPEMDENQRWDALTYAQDRSFSGGSPETMAQWSTVFNQVKGDLVTEGGTIPGDIAAAITEPYEPTAADTVMDAARDATSPQEFANVLAEGAASLNEGQLVELGNYALDQSLAAASGADNRAWQDIGGPLVRGEYQPPAPAGGGGGTRVQARGQFGAAIGGGPLEEALNAYLSAQRGTKTPEAARRLYQGEGEGEEEEQLGPPAPGRTQPGPFPEGYPREVSGYNFIQSPGPDIRNQILGQVPTPTPPAIIPDTDERRAQAQRIAYERALVQAGGSPSDIPWATWDTPPIIPDTDERRAQAQRDAMAQRQQELYGPRYHFPFNATGERVRMTEPVGIENEEYGPRYRFPFNATGERVRMTEPVGIENEEYGPRYRFPYDATGLPPEPTPGLTERELAELFPQGTGQITAANYGGGPLPTQIQQYLTNATRGGRRMRTGEERYEFPEGATGRRVRTGEERTAEERRRLARERTEEDWEYDPTTGAVNMRTYTRNQFRRAFQDRSHAIMARQAEMDRIYGQGTGFGQAMAEVYRAQLAGASPMQQAYAQRVQNITNAGIPLQAAPRVLTY